MRRALIDWYMNTIKWVLAGAVGLTTVVALLVPSLGANHKITRAVGALAAACAIMVGGLALVMVAENHSFFNRHF